MNTDKSLGQKLLNALSVAFLVLMFLATILLVVLSFFFWNKDVPPEILGYRIYLSKDSELDLIQKDYALFTKEADIAYLTPGNVIMYTNDEGKQCLSRVDESYQNGFLQVSDDRGNQLNITDTHYLYKIDFHSREIGYIITFILSPLGIVILALVPAIVLVLLELLKASKRKSDEPEVATIKKADYEDDIDEVLYDSKRSLGDVLDKAEIEKRQKPLSTRTRKPVKEQLSEQTMSEATSTKTTEPSKISDAYDEKVTLIKHSLNDNEPLEYHFFSEEEIIEKGHKAFDVDAILAELDKAGR